MLKLLKDSGCVLRHANSVIGLTGYADDTMAMCETSEEVKKTIQIVEKFCQKYDILLNGKKTVWMKLGEKPLVHPISKERMCKPSLPEENFVAAGVGIEKVYKFKFLGMTVTSDDNCKQHLDQRRLAAGMGGSDLDKIGLKNSMLDPEMKGLLLQTMIRTKLCYGLENVELNESAIKNLERLEGNIIKRYFNLPRRSYTTPILEVAGIRPLREAIESRRLSMLMQLLSNTLTLNIIMNGETNYSKTIAELGYVNDESLSPLMNKNRLVGMCLEKIKAIKDRSLNKTKSLIAQAIEKLLKNDTRDNNKLIRFIAHAENGLRDIDGIG